MNIGVVQMDVCSGDKAANYAKVKKIVSQACENDANIDLFILPELWSTGYALPELARLASEDGQEEADFLGELAVEANAWFAGGSVAARTPQGIVNRAQIINRSGETEQFYDKIHLVPMLDEHKYLVAGNSRCIHEIEGIVFGFAICYDIRFAELIRKLALDGAEALIVSAQWPLIRLNHWQTLLKARAIENQLYVLASNTTARQGSLFAGHSVCHGPDGVDLVKFEFEEDCKTCTLDTRKVRSIRQKIPVFKDRRPELY